MPSSNPSTTQLFVETLRVLGLENTRGASKFDRILSAHNKLADALSDMRNQHGPVAHGKDGFLDALTSNHTRAFLLTGDTILCLLLSALEGKDPDLEFTREPYERFPHLHGWIDSSVVVKSSIEDEEDLPVIVLTLQTARLPDGLELRVEPSRLLYSIDRTAYIELLAASVPEPLVSEEAIKEPSTTTKPLPPTQEAVPIAELVASYQGSLRSFRSGLQRYLDSLNLVIPATRTGEPQLVDSLLAAAERSMGVDWRVRPALLARMKVALRRVLVQFGVDREELESYVEHLVSWFRVQRIEGYDAESNEGNE